MSTEKGNETKLRVRNEALMMMESIVLGKINDKMTRWRERQGEKKKLAMSFRAMMQAKLEEVSGLQGRVKHLESKQQSQNELTNVARGWKSGDSATNASVADLEAEVKEMKEYTSMLSKQIVRLKASIQNTSSRVKVLMKEIDTIETRLGEVKAHVAILEEKREVNVSMMINSPSLKGWVKHRLNYVNELKALNETIDYPGSDEPPLKLAPESTPETDEGKGKDKDAE